MKKTFNIWMIVRDGKFLKAPWNPKPPMIFPTEDSAKNHSDDNAGDHVVSGTMTFQTENHRVDGGRDTKP